MQRRKQRSAEALDTTVFVETPERIRFAFQLAGPAQRSVAYLIDLLIRATAVTAVGFAAFVAGAGSQALAGAGFGVLALAVFLLEWGYYVACEHWMNGQSIGKRALGLRVVRTDGLPLGFAESVIRNLLRAADFLPAGYALGALICAADARFRRLGDLAAATMVVIERKQDVLPAVQLEPPLRPGELDSIPMRPSLDEEELDAIELFLRRSKHLNPYRGEELAGMVAPVFARRMRLAYRDPARFLALLHHRARGG